MSLRTLIVALFLVLASLLLGCGVFVSNQKEKASTRTGVRNAAELHNVIASCSFQRADEILVTAPKLASLPLPTGRMPLVEATLTSCDDSQIVELLLDQGAPVDSPDWDGTTPLGIAAGRSPKVVSLLLAHGANPNAINRHGDTPLLTATFLGQSETVRKLVAAGAKLDIFSATALGDTEALERMLRDDPGLVDSTRFGEHPIMLALRKRQVAAARVLLRYMSTPGLLAFTAAGDESGVRNYLDHIPLSARLPDRFGRYPLNYAIEGGQLQIARLLLERGADVKAGIPLEDAVRAGDIEAVKFLLDNGADPEAIPPPSHIGGVTRQNPPLYKLAIRLGHSEIAGLLHSYE